MTKVDTLRRCIIAVCVHCKTLLYHDYFKEVSVKCTLSLYSISSMNLKDPGELVTCLSLY